MLSRKWLHSGICIKGHNLVCNELEMLNITEVFLRHYYLFIYNFMTTFMHIQLLTYTHDNTHFIDNIYMYMGQGIGCRPGL